MQSKEPKCLRVIENTHTNISHASENTIGKAEWPIEFGPPMARAIPTHANIGSHNGRRMNC